MSVTSAVNAGRRAALRNMLDTVRVERPGSPVTDPATGAVTTPTTPVYEGRAKLGGDRPYESTPEAGGHQFTVQRYILHLPVEAGPLDAGDVAMILTAPLQPHLVDRVFRLAGRDERSHQTAQRVFVEEVVA